MMDGPPKLSASADQNTTVSSLQSQQNSPKEKVQPLILVGGLVFGCLIVSPTLRDSAKVLAEILGGVAGLFEAWRRVRLMRIDK